MGGHSAAASLAFHAKLNGDGRIYARDRGGILEVTNHNYQILYSTYTL